MTRVFYAHEAPEIELDFIRWTKRSLVVRYPPGMRRAGQEWRMGRRLVVRWLQDGVLRIEGDKPGWAQVV